MGLSDVTDRAAQVHEPPSSDRFEVVVVGGGNAGFSAALAAAEGGARVLVLEKAPEAWAGGNSYFTAGAFRLTYESLEELLPLLSDPALHADDDIDLPPYGVADYEADMRRVTHGRSSPELTRILASESRQAAHWLASKGVRWTLMPQRQAFRSDGRLKFWGNLPVGSEGGGAGLIAAHRAAATQAGVEVRFDSGVTGILTDGQGVTGVSVSHRGDHRSVAADAVVLAAGGFESDARLRAMYLGPGWELAKVRGTPYNTGEVLHLALNLGARPRGHWSGCHAIAWDAEAGDFGDREITNRWSRQGYPFGIVVNDQGRRFLDEGADFRNYTYAKYGAEILRQPNGTAYQVFDARTVTLISEVDYTTARESLTVADSISQLETALGIAPGALQEEVASFNGAVQEGVFDPGIRDGKRTVGAEPPKSNWALELSTPPFYAYRVSCGVTFTFGGLATDTDARVLDAGSNPIPGLYAAGEIMGGLFYHNYPGGSGLASGTVFGMRAGRIAAREALSPTR